MRRWHNEEEIERRTGGRADINTQCGDEYKPLEDPITHHRIPSHFGAVMEVVDMPILEVGVHVCTCGFESRRPHLSG